MEEGEEEVIHRLGVECLLGAVRLGEVEVARVVVAGAQAPRHRAPHRLEGEDPTRLLAEGGRGTQILVDIQECPDQTLLEEVPRMMMTMIRMTRITTEWSVRRLEKGLDRSPLPGCPINLP